MKLTRPAVFDQVVMGVMKAAKEGSLREKISDKKLIEMLDKISESSAAAITEVESLFALPRRRWREQVKKDSDHNRNSTSKPQMRAHRVRSDAG